MYTKISWADRVWNPVTGCDKVSSGCSKCYALRMAKRLKAMGQAGYQRDGDPRPSGRGFGVTLHPERLGEPLHWRKSQRIFVNSMSDLFHAEVPDAFIGRVFMVAAMAPQHSFLIPTKRPQRAKAWF